MANQSTYCTFTATSIVNGNFIANAPGSTTYATSAGRTNFDAVLNGTPSVAGDKGILAHGGLGVTGAFGEVVLDINTTPHSAIPTGAQIRAVSPHIAIEALETGDGAADGSPDVLITLAVQYPAAAALQAGGAGDTTTRFAETWGVLQIGGITSGTAADMGQKSMFGLDGSGNFPTALPTSKFKLKFKTQPNLSGSLTSPELRITTGQVNIFFNAAPSATPAITGGTTTANTVPVFTWTYSDPEGDPQERYRIQIVDRNNGNAIIYDSGEVFSDQTTFTMPSGYLRNFGSYRLLISVADVGSNGRYNVLNTASGAGGADQGLDFTVQAEPYLMPVIRVTATNPLFSAATASVGQVIVDPRYNLLSQADAAFETGGSASLGGWTLSDSTGSPSIATNATAFRGIGTARITASAASGTAVGMKSSVVAVTASTLLTATAKVLNNGGTRRQGQLVVQFYTDAGGTAALTGATPQTSQWTTPHWSTWWLTTRVPNGAVSARVKIIIASGNSETFNIDCVSLYNGSGNIADDASFESNGDNFWAQSAGGSVIQFDQPSNPTTTWPFTTVCGHGGGVIQTKADMGVHNSVFQVSADLASGSNVTMGFKFDDASTIASTISGLNVLTFNNKSTVLDCSALSTSRYGGFHTVGASTSHQSDNVSVEKLGIFTNGGFENGINGTALKVATAFGDYDGSATCQHDWQLSNDVVPLFAGATLTYDSTGANVHGGTMAANLGPVAGVDVAMEQWFSVQGWTTITPDWWWKAASLAVGSQAYFVFHDALGNPLSTTQLATISGTAAYAHVTGTGAIAVPTGAVWCRLVFYAVSASVSDMWVDDVTITANGAAGSQAYSTGHTPGANKNWTPVSPWSDGGWSGGGVTVYALGLQRSANGTAWSAVRHGTDSPIVAAVALPGTYTDYEYPASFNGSPQTFYYRSTSSITLSTGTTYIVAPYSNRVTMTRSTSFAPTEWMLIDLLSPSDNLALQVRKAKFETPETAQAYTPVGRNRKVIIADEVYGDSITLDLQAITHSDWSHLQTQTNKQRTLLLRSPDGEMWYVRAMKRSRERVWTGNYTTTPIRQPTVVFEEVDPLA